MGAWGIRVLSSLLLAGVFGVSVVGVSSAARRRNRLEPVVQAHVHAFSGYYVGASGYAVHRDRVSVFIDEEKCGANPSVEYSVHHADSQAWTVGGAFDRKSGLWTSSYRGILHLCVYLQNAAQPEFGTTGVLLRASMKYREICPASSNPITSSEGVPGCSVPHS